MATTIRAAESSSKFPAPNAEIPMLVVPGVRVKGVAGLSRDNEPVFSDGTVASSTHGCLTLPGQQALESRYNTDAHMAAYTTTLGRRLNKSSLQALADRQPDALPVFRWLVVDLDRVGHTAWQNTYDARVELRESLRATLDSGDPLLANLGAYATTRGLRLFAPVATPKTITPETAPEIERLNRGFAWALSERLNWPLIGPCGRIIRPGGGEIAIDGSALDWTRLMRLPRVVRDGHPTPDMPHRLRIVPVNLDEYGIGPMDWPRTQQTTPRVRRVPPANVPAPRAENAPRPTEQMPSPPVETADVSSVPLNDRLARATEIIAQTPPAREGEHSDDAVYRLACRLVRGCALAPEQVAGMSEWDAWLAACRRNDGTRFDPEWARQKLVSASRSARGKSGAELSKRGRLAAANALHTSLAGKSPDLARFSFPPASGPSANRLAEAYGTFQRAKSRLKTASIEATANAIRTCRCPSPTLYMRVETNGETKNVPWACHEPSWCAACAIVKRARPWEKEVEATNRAHNEMRWYARVVEITGSTMAHVRATADSIMRAPVLGNVVRHTAAGATIIAGVGDSVLGNDGARMCILLVVYSPSDGPTGEDLAARCEAVRLPPEARWLDNRLVSISADEAAILGYTALSGVPHWRGNYQVGGEAIVAMHGFTAIRHFGARSSLWRKPEAADATVMGVFDAEELAKEVAHTAEPAALLELANRIQNECIILLAAVYRRKLSGVVRRSDTVEVPVTAAARPLNTLANRLALMGRTGASPTIEQWQWCLSQFFLGLDTAEAEIAIAQASDGSPPESQSREARRARNNQILDEVRKRQEEAERERMRTEALAAMEAAMAPDDADAA